MILINSIPACFLALIQFVSSLVLVFIVNAELVKEDANLLDSIVSGLAANEADKNCSDLEFCHEIDYGPHSPYVPCNYLPLDFLDCEELIDHQGNQTSLDSAGVGCLKFGGQREVYIGSRFCHVLNGIECYGNRTFIRDGFPCLRYNGHYFVTTLLFSLLLGFLGMDRFYLGHTGTAIGKLLTIGGVGIWWIVDIILLITGNLMPEDGSNWMPYA